MMLLNLQLFGGRGGSSGAGGRARKSNASADGALANSEPRKLETIYRESRGLLGGYHVGEVLEAVTDGNGNLTFSYAKPISREKTAKTNRTQYLSFEVAHGAYNGETFGINWDKVKSIKGQTYSIRAEAKKAGLKWDGEKKMWRRK